MADADSNAIYGVIYLITNKINGKMYVGQTKQALASRLKGHKNSNGTSRITYAIKKYGVENFDIVQIDSAISLAELNAKEIAHIARLNTLDTKVGYNVSIGGGVVVVDRDAVERAAAKLRGRKVPPEQVEKMAATKRGRERSAKELAVLQKMIDGNKGRRHSDESRKRMSIIAIGKKMPPCTAEHRAKLSKAAKEDWARRKAKIEESAVA